MIDSVGITSLTQYTNLASDEADGRNARSDGISCFSRAMMRFVTGETLCVDGGWEAYGYL